MKGDAHPRSNKRSEHPLEQRVVPAAGGHIHHQPDWPSDCRTPPHLIKSNRQPQLTMPPSVGSA